MTTPVNRRALKHFRHDTRGSVFVEAALVMPIIVLILAVILEGGLALYQYHVLSTATGSALRQLIVSRGFPNPYSAVLNEFTTWANTMRIKSNQVTVAIQNASDVFTTCTSDAACTTLLDAASGKAARVTINYPCTVEFIPKLTSPCPIVITTTGLVE